MEESPVAFLMIWTGRTLGGPGARWDRGRKVLWPPVDTSQHRTHGLSSQCRATWRSVPQELLIAGLWTGDAELSEELLAGSGTQSSLHNRNHIIQLTLLRKAFISKDKLLNKFHFQWDTRANWPNCSKNSTSEPYSEPVQTNPLFFYQKTVSHLTVTPSDEMVKQG